MAGKGASRQPPERAGGQHAEPHRDPGVELLIRAGIVLASSLHDPQTTMREVARLTVPGLGDMCVIDLLDRDGSIKDVAVACADRELEEGLERMRSSFPLNPDGEHPAAVVIRSGHPMLLERMDSGALRSYAESDAHARFMIQNGYRSAVVAPLVARDRTLGAISVLRLGEREGYRSEDLDLVQALAWRAALAIDNARLFSELRVLEERMEAVLVNLAEAITVEDRDGRLIFANQAAADLLGALTPEELTSAPKGTFRSRYRNLDEHGRELPSESMPGRRLFAGERTGPLLLRNVARASGEERWLVVRSSPVRDPERGEIVYAVNVLENVTDIKRAQLAGDFLAEVSRVLASSMDYGLTLERVTQLAVPQIADWCAIDVVDERGQTERVAAHPPGTGPPFAKNAAITVPMTAAGKVIGEITLATTEPGRRLGREQLELAEELGRRAGGVVENARLYTERTRIARTLQQALLPESLPHIPGVDLQALYTAVGELNEVGGDFYDVFDYREDRWMLVIGDVCGKGPRAAAVTALARYTLRAAAMSGHSPVGMLTMLHRALLRGRGAAELCTVCLVTLAREAQRARLTVTLAGHPPPLLMGAGGEIEQVGRIGTLLGAIDPLNVEETGATLEPGHTLLLYTDGVTDAGTNGEVMGEDGLLQLCAEAGGLAPKELLSRIEQAALERSEGSLRDDLALLAVHLHALDEPRQ
jgi:PAS domain S-box-containing protein